MRHCFVSVLILLLSLPGLADPAEAFQAGNSALEAGQYEKALEYYRQALLEEPTDNLLWNAGLAAYFSGQAEAAIEYWGALKESSPEDLRLRSKLVQAYQLKGDFANRDRERAELLEIWKAADPKPEQKFFCRDQFKVGDKPLLVFEDYEMTPPRGIRYTFIVLDPQTQKEDHRLSLGSYDPTNAFMQEMGKVEPGQRGFHLDGYYDRGRRHSTFGMFGSEPSYDEVKSLVRAILEGRRSALSGSEKDEDGEVEINISVPED